MQTQNQSTQETASLETTPQFDINVEHLERLKQDLATAQQEVETLRAAAASSTQETAPQSTDAEGVVTKSVAEQVEEQVAQLRVQLEEQHNLSKEQLEAQYNNRTNIMKQKLNQKLREDKEKFKEEGRQEAMVKHSEELQNLRQEHEAAVAQLKEEHRLEVERLTKEGQLAVERAQAKEQPATTPPEAPSQPPAEPNGAPAPAPVVNPAELAFTDEQARDLVAKNVIIRGIVSRNIQNKVGTETTKLKQEHEKVLQDKAEEAKKEKEQALAKAVNMETIKQKAKLGMAEGQTRAAKAKLDVVERAAAETPQRPVVEVWEIAKVTKPAPAMSAQTNKPAQSPMSSPFKAAAFTAPQSPGMQPPQPAQPGQLAQPDQSAQVTPNSQPPQDKMQARMQKFAAPAQAGGTFGQPSLAPNQGQPEGQAQQPVQAVPQAVNDSPAQPQSTNGAAPQNQGGQVRQVSISGPGAVRVPPSVTPSGIPTGISTGIPRGNASMLPRGGTMIRGRGGFGQPGTQQQAQGISVQGAAGQGQRGGMMGLPRGGGNGRGRGGGRGVMNPGANQFAPGPAGTQGNKRPHEGGDEGAGKRMRGGAGGT